ncbi:modification methylase BsuBI family protein [delta proteobacterium NaphS2]|nr:modification methylase BsuBI family protein [delta proteobacterium NaphS2]
MLPIVEQSRLILSKSIESKQKSSLGQYFTPATIAHFMADLFLKREPGTCYLLDAGAGIGSLSAAFLDRWTSGGLNFDSVKLDAFEIDQSLHPFLHQALEQFQQVAHFTPVIRGTDFIRAAANWIAGNLFAEALPKYTHAILNPPYKKIRSNSIHRTVLRQAGIGTVNLYSAFLALSILLLEEQGELVAIVPRSFCNGPYYRSFRDIIFERTAIRQIHLFASRTKAFKDDDVLQENIIIHLLRGGRQGKVIISTSTDDGFDDLTLRKHPFERIVFPDDPERFIHIPTSSGRTALESYSKIHYSLSDLGIQVSTGPVVDFRLKKHLRKMPVADAVPLIYPVHFNGNRAKWPNDSIKKPNAICHNRETEKWLFPKGFYCVVRRFSSKEEKRRVIANVIDPSEFGNAPLLGFENHLNVFHDNKHGLPQALAVGLSAFLNSTPVDEHFRRFNGHTQVNATDLRTIRYPNHATLILLGKWALEQTSLTQEMIDRKLEVLAS